MVSMKSVFFSHLKMPRKRLPTFQKVSKLLKVFIFIAKMRKLIAQKLELIRKLQKTKKLKLLKHYNYGFLFLGEYEFSPSNTPLITYQRKKEYYSMFSLCRCLGRLQVESEEEDYSLEALHTIEDVKDGTLLELPLYCGNEEDSIDLQAERFIQRFYEDMRKEGTNIVH